jgi:hypothetical protein
MDEHVPTSKVYSFNDVIGTVDPCLDPPGSSIEPVKLEFDYVDKGGVRWRVVAQGIRVRAASHSEDHTSFIQLP